jgi:hypothetical protein
MRTYLEYRLHARIAPQLAQREELARQLDQLRVDLDVDAGDPRAREQEYARVLERMRELELATNAPRNDVQLLDVCQVARRARR